MYRIFLLCIFLIAYGSLYPWRFEADRSIGNPLLFLLQSWRLQLSFNTARDMVVNLLLYAPLGAAGYLSMLRVRSTPLRLALPVLCGSALSVMVETLQIYDSTRVCSLIDVFCNTIGAAAGAISAAVVLYAGRRTKFASLLRPEAAGSILLLLCWGAYQVMTVAPNSRLEASSELISATWTVFAVNVAMFAVEWLVAVKMAESVVGLVPARLMMALLATTLPLKFVLGRHRVYWPEVVGVLLAAVLWTSLAKFRPFPNTPLALVFCLLLLVRGLVPFHFSALAHSFNWVPFDALFDSERQTGLLIFARKIYDYGAPIWLLYRARLPIFVAGTGVALVLALTEAIQLHIPSRASEITDPLLALLTALMLWSLRRTSLLAAPLETSARRVRK